VRKRAGFLNAHLWATPYKQDERFAAGDYINQSSGGEGLPKWTAANRSIDNQDLVLWYTLGVTHIPRPEEWPVMTCHRAGFKLMPAGFFARNPALDVPK
jgi:primary-amine oxidase